VMVQQIIDFQYHRRHRCRCCHRVVRSDCGRKGHPTDQSGYGWSFGAVMVSVGVWMPLVFDVFMTVGHVIQ
jgi:hypothetical protein